MIYGPRFRGHHPVTASVLILQVAPVGSSSGNPLAVQPLLYAQDGMSNHATTFTGPVTVTLNGSGTLSGTQTVNAVAGTVSFTNLTITGSGPFTLTFKSSLPAVTSPPSATIAPTSLAMHTQPVGAASGNVLATQPVVYVLDNNGNLDTTLSTGTVTAAIHTGTSVLSGTMTVTITAGVATFTDLVATGADTDTLIFTCSIGGVSTVVSASFTMTSATVFSSDWSTATGNSDNALKDGSNWDFLYQSQLDIIDVIANSGLGWTLTPNVLQVTFRGAGPSAAVQTSASIPQSTTWWGRFYFRVDDTTQTNNHPVLLPYSGSIQLVPWARESSNPAGVRISVRPSFDGNGSGVVYPYNNWYASTPGVGVDHLPFNTWFRMEWQVEYVTSTVYKIHPRLYNLAGTLLYDESSFFQNDYNPAFPPMYSLATWYALGGNAHLFSVTDTDLARRFAMGNEGPGGSSDTGGHYYFAHVGVSTAGWLGA